MKSEGICFNKHSEGKIGVYSSLDKKMGIYRLCAELNEDFFMIIILL